MKTRRDIQYNLLDHYMIMDSSEPCYNKWYKTFPNPYVNPVRSDIADAINKSIEHQQVAMLGEKEILHALEKINNDLNVVKEMQEKSQAQRHMPPDCLLSFLDNQVNINNIKVESIIAELQYHLGVLVSPGTEEELAPFKEHKEISEERKKYYALECLNQFINH
jgi:hypothetical protein